MLPLHVKVITYSVCSNQSPNSSCERDRVKSTRNAANKKVSAEAAFRSAFAERLRQAAQDHGIGELATKIGVTPTTLYRWLNGQFDPSLPKLNELAEAMNISLAWLVTGNGPTDRRQALRHALLEGYGTTDFELAVGVSEKPPIAFHEPWLFELLYGPTEEPALFGATDLNAPLLMEVRDDSMEPTIAKGDLLLADRSFGMRPSALERSRTERRSPHDGIYVFEARPGGRNGKSSIGSLIVRRVQYRLDETIAIRCDNANYPEEIYPLKAPNRPAALGRVVWRGGRM